MFTQKQLAVFRAVMQTGSVSAAGRRMNLSQPSVSRILGDLERQFGVPLFQRKSKGVSPTPEAEAFLEEVERNYLVLTNLEEAAAQIARKERGTLSIATITAASLEIVPSALARLQVAEKNIKVVWQVKSSKWVLDFARSGTLRTGFANVLHMPSGMRVLHEGTLPHMCLVPAEHPLGAQRTPLSLRDLRPYPIIGLLGQVADELAVRNVGANIHSPLTAETSLAAITLSQHCGGLPIVDAFTAHYWHQNHDGQPRIVEDLPDYRFAVFEPLGTSASLIDREFQTYLIEEVEKIQAWLSGFNC
ncbi:LysR family transcriptional regulator [Roseibium sp. RKSG952]|uniref:LysR family transcriptional regulator n=1 Tax=Roseibium sp. RKSG952 TaxID=2529384 RepID=UPI0012BCEF95|nr:LysR family transcriptional regulator [Roseibium sp. RKSG952]MTI03377.1 LysR family transcriptional regulator [Roseibium sp. RKSG952]